MSNALGPPLKFFFKLKCIAPFLSRFIPFLIECYSYSAAHQYIFFQKIVCPCLMTKLRWGIESTGTFSRVFATLIRYILFSPLTLYFPITRLEY